MENLCFRNYSRETKDLILKLLTKNPEKRITPEQALQHRYFVRNGLAKPPPMIMPALMNKITLQESALRGTEKDFKSSQNSNY